uniref:Uncharacterized protein n=1 Tax=Romanomermis culicivorax TaxID=13658 RepID=A0A915JIC0_ROMCU
VSKTRNHLQVLLWRDVKLSKIQRVGTGVYTVPEFYDQIMQLKQIEGSNDGFFVRNDDLVDPNHKSKSGRKRSHEKSDQTGINVLSLARETNGFPPNNTDSNQNDLENPAKKKNKCDKTFFKQEFNEKNPIDGNSQVDQDEDDRPPNLVANDQALDLSLIAKLKSDRNSVNGQSPPQVDDVEKSVNVVVNCSQKRSRRSSNDQNKNTKRNLTKNGNAAKTSDVG